MRPIVLLHPRLGFYDLFVRDLPLGLLSLASTLVGRYEVTIIDQRLSGWRGRLEAALKRDPLCVGVTAKTGGQIRYGLELSRLVRQKCRATVVWGGVHPTLLPEQTVENGDVDMVVQGEGEHAFRELVDALAAGRSPEGIAGVWYKEGGTVRGTAAVKEPLDLDSLPLLPYELIRFEDYTEYSPQNFGRVFYLETGRGCKNSCTYCYHSGMPQKKRRAMTAENIARRIEHLGRFTRLDGVTFVDDSFLTERDRVFPLISLMKEKGMALRWNCEANIVDMLAMSDEQIGTLEASGLTWVGMGVESGSDRILRSVRKGITVDMVREVDRRLRPYDFFVRYNFMNGFAGETEEDLRMTVDLIGELLAGKRTNSVQLLGIAVPYPGTAYHEAALRNGLAPCRRLEDWIDFAPDRWYARAPWLSATERAERATLFVLSQIMDNKADINIAKNGPGRILRAAVAHYRGLARRRFAMRGPRFPLELLAFKCLRGLSAWA